ncbi:MAG: serine/threonine-protein kinase, partial [Bryobacteraceae bacterium]
MRQLFRELADVPREERARIFAHREIPGNLRSEVESLLKHDSTPGESLSRRVSVVAEEALLSSHEPASRRCGPYRLERLIGSGGMGDVYLAQRHDGEIEQKVAIKLLRADTDRPAWRDRFLRERQLLAYLSHPSIARLLDAGHTGDGRPYLVMEYVDGVTIDQYAATLDLRSLLRLFLLVCDGVSHAHRRLIVHRDLKPSNILVDSSGNPKLLDFGIARLQDAAVDETRTVERVLTPNYASPEQLRGDIQTTATDVYSLGAMLHKLLTGRSPREQLEVAPAALPPDIDHILRKALRDEPEERYASVDALADDIRAVLESRPVQARSGDAWYRTRKFLRRYWVPAAATALVIASLSAGLWVANRERDIAQHRFQQVRRLANKVLALDSVMRGIPGSTKARHQIAAMSQEYLEALRAGAAADKDLAFEIGVAYVLLANVQGVPTSANLGQYAQADESLRKADALIEPVLAASPEDRNILLT